MNSNDSGQVELHGKTMTRHPETRTDTKQAAPEQTTGTRSDGGRVPVAHPRNARQGQHVITIRFDGGCRPTNPGRKYGSYSVDLDGTEVLRKSRVEFGHGTNNEAEFNALELALLETLEAIRADGVTPAKFQVRMFTDSKILVNRMSGRNRGKIHAKYAESSQRMVAHANRCMALLTGFAGWTIAWQSRNANVENFGH